MAEYVYIGAEMNVSLPPVFRKWIASVEVVPSCGRKTDLMHVPGNLTSVRHRDEILQLNPMHVIDHQRELSQENDAMAFQITVLESH